MKKILIVLCLLLAGITFSYGHGGEQHEEEKPATDTAAQVEDHAPGNSMEAGGPPSEGHTTASWDDFPNLHPMVVHFPIVLLILAALMQLASFFVFKRELSIITLVVLALGFIGAYAAGRFFHAHTHELPENIQIILEEHEWFASATIWLSGVAIVLKLLSIFLFKRKVWMEALVFIAMAGTAWYVGMAAHHGAQLVHIEGVGPKGKYLETGSGHSH